MQALIQGAPLLGDYLDAASRGHFATLCAMLDGLGIAYTISSALGARTRLLYAHSV